MMLGKGTSIYLYFYSGSYPHNFIWSALLEGGIIKLSIILLWIYFYIRGVYAVWHQLSYYGSLFLVGGFLIYLIYAFISSREFFDYSKIAWLLVIALFLLPEKRRINNESSSKWANALRFQRRSFPE